MGFGEFLAGVQARAMAGASAATRDSYPEVSALDAEEIDAFVERVSYPVLSTTRPDGRPHAAPVGYVPTDDRIWMASVAGAARAPQPRRAPVRQPGRGRGQPRRAHRADRRGNRPRHPDPQRILDDWLRDAWRDRYGTELTWAGSLIELEPTKVLSYGHGRVLGLGR